MPYNLSDQEYQFLQSKRQVADFVESIYNDPNLTKEAKRLIKRKYPQLQIPDLDIEDRVERRIAEVERERSHAETSRREAEEQASWQDRRKKTQTSYGFTDEAMERLEKMMVEKNVGDYDVAASYLAAKEPKPSEAGFDTYRWNHEKQPGFAEIAKDPEGWGRSEILKAIQTDQDRSRGR
jgi:hypothetical protein